MPKNERAVKSLLQNKLIRQNKASVFPMLWTRTFALSLAGLLVICLAASWLSKDSVALAHINPFATSNAKAKNFLQSAAKTATQSPLDSTLPFKEELEKALKAKDTALVKDIDETSDDQRQNEQYLVNGQVVESLGSALQMKPKEVKKQIRFTQEDGSTVFLGFTKEGELVFKAEGIAKDDEDETEGEREPKKEDKRKTEGQVKSRRTEKNLTNTETTAPPDQTQEDSPEKSETRTEQNEENEKDLSAEEKLN